MAHDISARKSSEHPRRDNFRRQIVLQIVAANDYARTTLYIICQDFFALFSLPQNSSISHPPSSPFSTLTPFTFSFHPTFRSLRAANFSQSHPRFPLSVSNLRLLLPRTFLLLRGIFLSVRLASRHAFPSHKLLVSRATLHRDARHPVAAVCSCRAVVIFGRVERRASVLGIRQMLLWFFAPPAASAPLSPRYCFPRVFRTFALFACMVIWNAPRVPERCGPPFVAIFLFTLGSWTIPCVMLFEVFVFAHSRVVIFYL